MLSVPGAIKSFVQNLLERIEAEKHAKPTLYVTVVRKRLCVSIKTV